ncbi:hypothetical protein [Planktothricoides raciborskii]|uniref:Uncharacterized protein n=1 Tax=Planktothricoides raciborskii GIHE-MW2 TaxID=2792601 RepID=A0AAU8JJY5_9CYAN|nr:hypothetical protein [Planktothricoides raciborskii]
MLSKVIRNSSDVPSQGRWSEGQQRATVDSGKRRSVWVAQVGA